MIVRASVKDVQEMERGWGKRNQVGGFCTSFVGFGKEDIG